MTTPDEVRVATDESIAEVRNYVEQRTGRRGLDPDEIHSLDIGADSEAHLMLTDLRALLARLSEYERALGPRLSCGRFAVEHGSIIASHWQQDYIPCFYGTDSNADSHTVTPEYEEWLKSREE